MRVKIAYEMYVGVTVDSANLTVRPGKKLQTK